MNEVSPGRVLNFSFALHVVFHNTRPNHLLGVECTVYFLSCVTTILPPLPYNQFCATL